MSDSGWNLLLISWPPAYRLSYLMQCAVDYFSVRYEKIRGVSNHIFACRIIVDAPHETSVPSVYSMEPHGWLPLPQAIHVFLLIISFFIAP